MKPSQPNPFPWFTKTNVNQSLTQKVDFERTLTLLGQDSKSASNDVKRAQEDSRKLSSKARLSARISAFVRQFNLY